MTEKHSRPKDDLDTCRQLNEIRPYKKNKGIVGTLGHLFQKVFHFTLKQVFCLSSNSLESIKTHDKNDIRRMNFIVG